jgi:ankyrin repeat protein
LKELIDSGVHVDATRGAGGRTGLMRASENGHLRAVELLLGSGAQVSQKGGRTGRPALLRACGNGHFDVAKILVDHGADVNSTDALGMTSLMLAAITANYDLVEMLIRRGADPNARDNQGQTALMHVVSRYMPIPFRTIIRVLVQSGADVNVTDARGRTVLDYAIEANLNDLAALLRSYEARSGHRQEQSRSAPTTTGIDEYYSMLDCKPTDSDAEIRRRYHLLVKDYHPDVIQRKGLPEDFVRYATERFQEISEAFQQIVKHRQENRG